MEKDWIMVFTSEQMYQAEIAKQILENEEIEVIEMNKKDSTYLSFGNVEIYVHIDNVQLATELLKPLKIE